MTMGNKKESLNEQEDFYIWLRRLPIGFLQELYRQYNSKRSVQQDTSPTEKIAPAGVIVIRRSIFILIITMLGIEVFFDAIYIAIRIPPLYLNTTLLNQMNFTTLYFLAFLILNLFKVVFMINAALQWLTHVYEIRDNEVRYKYGILRRDEKIFICSLTQEVAQSQGILGRIFNFGTISVTNPTIKEQIYLESIPNPQKYAEIIKNSMHSAEVLPIQSPNIIG